MHNRELLGVDEIKLFEIGTVWQGGKEEVVVAAVSEQEAQEEHVLKPIAAEAYEILPLSKLERYQPFSRYPSITRDVSFWVPKGSDEAEIRSLIETHAGELLVRLDLFDRYEKGERTSLAFRLIFQSYDKTLTDHDANERMESVYAGLREKGYEIR